MTRCRLTLVAVASLASAVLLGGCGSSSSSSPSASGAAGGSSGTTKAAAATGTAGSATDTALYSGARLKIPAGSSPAVHGKTIGVVTLTSASEVFPRELAAIRQAAGALGDSVKQANMQGDVSQAGPAVENLLQSGVNGIILQSVEPELLGSKAIADAKAKHVPIIETGAVANSKNSNGVLTGSVNTDVAAAQTELDKQMLAALPNGSEIALVNDKLAAEGRVPEAELRKDVAGKLKIVATHQMNYANLVPDISSTVSTWLQQYPDLKAVWCPYDGPCVGAAQAIQSANKDVRVYSQDGVTSILNLMRAGVKITTAATPLEYVNWLAVDELNSIFGHRHFIADPVVPSVMVSEKNVPRSGVIDGSQLYGDYPAAFKKRWGVGG
jgi:ABC-type sugar transport system substrate-binding protein